MAFLTKSKYLIGLSCLRHLWMTVHTPDKIPPSDPATKYLTEQGEIVGQLAKTLFPEGIDLPVDPRNLSVNLEKTQELLPQRKPLFEPGFVVGQLYSRADILVPAGIDEWDLIEVKASTKTKPEHIDDLSFQTHVYRLAGIKIRNCSVLHLDRDYLRLGVINPSKLFALEEVTGKVGAARSGIEERIIAMLDVIDNPQSPNIRLGQGCNNGLECISEDCWNFLPDGHVFELYSDKRRGLALLKQGVVLLKDIPDAAPLNVKQRIQKECAVTGEAHVNREGINHFLGSLRDPLSYLDFETFQTAVPIYDGTRPYQQIPFQFSVHVDHGDQLTHFEYLHDTADDPRERLLSELQAALSESGSIVVFNQSFEISRLREMADAFPMYKPWVETVVSRIADLIVPFREFHYYHPAQRGSCSIKRVLPAVIGSGYEGLNIDNGGLASVSYVETILGGRGNKDQIRNDLLQYCAQDTKAMYLILEKLKNIVK